MKFYCERLLSTGCYALVLLAATDLAFLSQPAWAADEAPEKPAPAASVDFRQEIFPLLSQNCLACHNAKKAEGGLNLESHASLMLGGDSGAAVMASNLEESYLLTRVTDDSEGLMPPEDNTVGAKPLTAEQLQLLQAWIAQGALDSTSSTSTSTSWTRMPAELNPIYASATSADGNLLAVGRGNRVELIDQQTPTETTPRQTLIDPSLKLSDGKPLDASHFDIVHSLAFSHDSQRLATGGYRSVKLWRRQTNAVQHLAGLPSGVTMATLSPNNSRLAYATGESSLEVVDLQSGQSHRFLKSHSSPITALGWVSEDHLLSCDASGAVSLTTATTYQASRLQLPENTPQIQRLLSVGEHVLARSDAGKLAKLSIQDPTGKPLSFAHTGDQGSQQEQALTLSLQWLELPEEITALDAVTAPTPLLAIALKSGVLQVLDLTTLSLVKEFPAAGACRFLTLSLDGALLASTLETGVSQLWSLESGEKVCSLDKDYVQSQRLTMAESDAARQKFLVEKYTAQVPTLKTASEAEEAARVKVQEARDKAAEELKTKDAELATAQTGVSDTEAALASAQAAVAAAMKQVETVTAELEAKKKAAEEASAKQKLAQEELANREQALATSTDSAERAAARIPEMESLVSLESERLTEKQAAVEQLAQQPAPLAQIACQFSHDRQRIIMASTDNVVRVYDTQTGRPIVNLLGATSSLAELQPSAKGSDLLALTVDGRVLAWNLALPWQLERVIGTADESPFSDRITALDFSPDDQKLAIGSGPPSRFGDIQLLEVSTGEVLKDLGQAHSDSVLSLRFSPDGRWLASGGADKLCRLFDVESGEMIRAFEGHSHHVLAVDWQNNGQQLATASADNSIKVWSADTGEQQRTIAGFSKEVTSVHYLGQTTQFIATAADGSVRLYNADDGKQIRVFSGAENAIYSAAPSADGKRVTVGGQLGQLWSWQVDDGHKL
ncbi:WD40 domain-containing protein [Aureliella helgolandensis]|uniref:Chromosome partition protein Smc n=1 Tax=Aureliella helgolandensis TaxID=2527968 RepID=A0A518G0F4_9BACT|nr:c-type cytochrome domain-containing protein [Aureliella helgolandensis]QDV22020.1 Chromosome partition protein Smc [Aureliella helgolandensis]